MTGAVVLRLLGEAETHPVRFAEEAASSLNRAVVVFPGFNLLGLVVTDYRLLDEAENRLALTAVLQMQDVLQRRLLVALASLYRVSEDEILVERAAVTPFFPAVPSVRVFFLPAEADPDGALINGYSHAELLAFALGHAVTPDRGPNVSAEEREYFILAFFLDRLATDAGVQLRVSDRPEGMEGSTGGSYVLDFAGWKVVVMRGAFALGGGKPLYFKALYKPGGHVPEEGRRVVLAGTFSTSTIFSAPAE